MQALASYLSVDLVLFIVFLALNLIIGLRVGTKVKTMRDFAIGNKGFSTGALTSTVVATWVGGGFLFYNLQNIYVGGLKSIIIILGSPLCLLIMGRFLSLRMKEFLEYISIAEAMGSLYGKSVRVITAISGVLIGLGYTAIQFQLISKTIIMVFGIDMDEFTITTVAAGIVILYSSFGGIRAVTITDIFQFITFSIFIPILALVIWNHLKSPDKVMNMLVTNPIFDFHKTVGWHSEFITTLAMLLFFMVPGIQPATFQRIAMAKDLEQIKRSNIYASVIVFVMAFAIAWIAILLITINPGLDPGSLVNYMVDQYAYVGLKGLIAVGITAMAMSTADSHVNASTVLLLHDIIKVFRPKWKESIYWIRIASVLLGVLSLVLALYIKGLLNLIMLGASFYLPIVTIPFLLAVFGFRSGNKAILLGMAAGFITMVFWPKLFGELGINNVIPAMLANLIFSIGSHYLLKQPGGWVGIKDKLPLLVARQKRKEYWENLFHAIKEVKIYNYLQKNLPERDVIYCLFGLYALGATYSLFFTIPESIVTHYQRLYDVAAHSVLVCTAALITYPAWPPTFRAKWFITYAWPAAICYIFFIAGIQLVLMSEFNGIQVMIFLLNLMLASFFLTPTLSLILAALGMLIGYGVFRSHYGPISLTGVASSLQFNSIYLLLAVSTFLMAIFRNKNKQDKMAAEKDHLGKAYTGKRKSYRK